MNNETNDKEQTRKVNQTEKEDNTPSKVPFGEVQKQPYLQEAEDENDKNPEITEQKVIKRKYTPHKVYTKIISQ
jgi:hypothetical protein